MTLGGIAVAVGELVDDAVVDIENIFRRLKENRQKAAPEPALRVIYLASSEVRNSIVYATVIVCLVVLPLFALSGLEGRLFAPLGLAYVVSLAASLVVSLTVTPVLASYLLPRARFLGHRRDPLLLRGLKWLDARVVRFALHRPRLVLGVSATLALLAVVSVGGMGGEFLPEFNEGTVTVGLQARPGTSLRESQRLGRRAEELLLEVPEVISVTRRTGRAEMDEHAEGVHSSEIDVRLREHERPRPGFGYALLRMVPGLHAAGVTSVPVRPREEVVAAIRDPDAAGLPGVKANVGQPISHRLDHVMSGTRAQIAVKIFGSDLRRAARRRPRPGVSTSAARPTPPACAASWISRSRSTDGGRGVAGAPGGRPRPGRRSMAWRPGTWPACWRSPTVARSSPKSSTATAASTSSPSGTTRNHDASPKLIGETLLDTPSGRKVALSQVARVLDTTGPGALNREGVQRRIVVSCNVQGRGDCWPGGRPRYPRQGRCR